MLLAVLILVAAAVAIGVAVVLIALRSVRPEPGKGLDVFEEATAAVTSAYVASTERVHLGSFGVRDQLLTIALASAWALNLRDAAAEQLLRDEVRDSLARGSVRAGLVWLVGALVRLVLAREGGVGPEDIGAAVSAQRWRTGHLLRRQLRRQPSPDPAWGVLVQNAVLKVKEGSPSDRDGL